MTIDELQQLEDALYDIISNSFDEMPNAGTLRWDLQKVDLINKVKNELSHIVVD